MPVPLLQSLLLGSIALFAPLHSSSANPEIAFTRADGIGFSAAQIDASVNRLMGAGKVHGLALALIEEGEVAYLKAYGWADIDEQRALQTDTIMYGASLTKAAFAYATMTLVDEGLIDLDRSIVDYLPQLLHEYDNYVDLADDPRWQLWTMRMLLSHSAGLPNWRFYFEGGKLQIVFEPGSRYAYSGEGIQVAQFVLEQGFGLDVNVLMQKRVFDRFGMQRTSMMWREDFRLNFARGYSEAGENLGHNMRQSVRAAGSMDTTAADFASFLAGLMRAEGLSPASHAAMLSPQVRITARHQFPTHFPEDPDANDGIALSYGLGWGIFESAFGRAFFKEGHDDGTNNYALCLMEAGKCILLLANSSNGEGIFLYLVDELLGKTGLPWEWEGYVPYDEP